MALGRRSGGGGWIRISEAVAWVAAGALLLAGCSSGNSGGGSGGGFGGLSGGGAGGVPTTIAQALAQLPATSWDTDYAEFGDVKQLVALDGGEKANGPLLAYVGLGESSFAAQTSLSDSPLGFDPLAVTAAAAVGNEPHQITVDYNDFDASAVGSKLSKEGFKQHGTADGGDLWSIGGDDEANVDNPTGLPNLNVLLVSSSRITLGGSSADVKAIAGPVSTPLSGGAMGAVADCLGPALAAMIGPRTGGTANASLLGIGLLAPSAADASEELCVQVPSAAQAAAMAATWKTQIGTGLSERIKAPWSTLLTDPQATVLSPVNGVTTVRLTAKPASGAHLGALLQTYFSASSDMDGLLGQS
ncbi:hypothetical protein [Actinospica robiniae]|uniref:hypothetical protein n=1 Tax=Actinospica robiniae TaxID=304901 RepID=UPI0004048DD5|nr:hypothetical protein [Actinospica robiniae]